MTLFEFLMAIASVVIAIALTEIFGGWGHLLRTHILPKIDWLHLCWTLVVVLYAIQYWVGIWPYLNVEFRYIYQVWFLIFPTLFIVLVSFAITPDIDPDENFNLREYYLSRRGPIFFGLAAFLAMAQLADLIIPGVSFEYTNPSSYLGVGLIVIAIIPAVSKKIWMHTSVLIVNLLFVLSIGFGYLPSGLST
ncbi:MAG: hypothetical protein COA96_03725 [SAR86 cluster bacterium]|uniref:Uncharacterized protein n=1 Tax=SAR86 cluster bacterium TaxID=2030880 RepID=A0A2A5B752_9GAMM|nr:MAG: hypothetical protein COA96_03725 [SAR86 cluster bacterium]